MSEAHEKAVIELMTAFSHVAGGDSNPRPSGYEPDELPLLHPATMMPAPASSPAREAQYHPALARFTTGFGMGPGGATPL